MQQEVVDAMTAVKAVIDIARANFPADTNVTVSTVGKQTASVTISCFLLAQMLRNETPD